MRFRKLRIAWSVVCGYRVRAADRVVGAELLVIAMTSYYRHRSTHVDLGIGHRTGASILCRTIAIGI